MIELSREGEFKHKDKIMDYIYNVVKKKKSKSNRSSKKQLSIKEQLFSKVIKPGVIKETPQDMVERLWIKRGELYKKMANIKFPGSKNRVEYGRLSNQIFRLDDKIQNICETRNIKHPGL